MKNLVKVLKKYHLTLSSAESLTGGLFGAQITKYTGVSKIYKGGQIVYSNLAKSKLLNVDIYEVEKIGAISAKCAELLATSICKYLNSDIAIAFTGNAGPTRQEDLPIGLVYIAVSYQSGLKVESRKLRLKGTRIEIQKKSVQEGIKLLLEIIERENLWQKI